MHPSIRCVLRTFFLLVEIMDHLWYSYIKKYFNKDKCIVKITPIHKTIEAEDNGYEIVTDFDVYEQFEKSLVDAGWDVIVFIPSKEEDEDRITCGNSLIALKEKNNE